MLGDIYGSRPTSVRKSNSQHKKGCSDRDRNQVKPDPVSRQHLNLISKNDEPLNFTFENSIQCLNALGSVGDDADDMNESKETRTPSRVEIANRARGAAGLPVYSKLARPLAENGLDEILSSY